MAIHAQHVPSNVVGSRVLETGTQRHLDLIAAVWAIMRQQHVDRDARIMDALRVGCEMFGERVGVVARIADGIHTVTHAHGPGTGPEPGQARPLAGTVCALTMDSPGPVAIDHLAASPWRNHPGRAGQRAESYIGTAIEVAGRRYGTVSFYGPQPVDAPFRAIDRQFVGMLGQWIGTVLTEGEQERTLRESLEAHVDFIATTNHELRAPLAGIRGITHLLLSGARGDLGAEQRELVESAQRAADHLLALVDDLSELSRIDAGSPALDLGPVDAGELVARAVAMVGPLADEAGHSLTVTAGAPSAALVGDDRRLTQVVVNLLVNAIRYTPGGGQIAVAVTTSEHDVEMSVTDNGPGIPADRLDTIFDRYSRLRPRGGDRYLGTGLGLAVSREVARLHGGDIFVASQEAVGSTFTLVLPRRHAAGRRS